ncbi:MAG: thiamine phosphate synthase [Elusimicrobia bacterium]|nr:thiamine phosphate synthase [Elusimicrobiota bacterium]
MKRICVTNRKLCQNDFFMQIENICMYENIYALILREKDLDDKKYKEFALKCNDICKKNNVLFFINSKINIAEKLDIKNIQISFKDFIENKERLNKFDNIAVSVHSLEEAKIAEGNFRGSEGQKIGRSEMTTTNDKTMYNKSLKFLIVGHIFQTDCKKGLEPKGTEFLKEICDNVSLPVFAIGGINEKTINKLNGITIEGICMMSNLMQKTYK